MCNRTSTLSITHAHFPFLLRVGETEGDAARWEGLGGTSEEMEGALDGVLDGRNSSTAPGLTSSYNSSSTSLCE